MDDLSSPDWMEKHEEMILHMRWWLGGGDVMAEMNATIDDLLCTGAFDIYSFFNDQRETG